LVIGNTGLDNGNPRENDRGVSHLTLEIYLERNVLGAARNIERLQASDDASERRG